MKNKRILYLSTHPFENRGAFSGTNRRIYDALSGLEGFEAIYYQATPNAILKFSIRLFGAVYRLFMHKSFQTGLEERYFKSICTRTLRYLKKHPCDIIVAWQICFGGVFEQWDGAKVFFSDSTYHRIVPYYQWKVSKKQFAKVDQSQALLLKYCHQFWCFSSGFVSDAVEYYGTPMSKVFPFRFFPTTVGTFMPKKNHSGALRLLLVGTNYADKGVAIAIEIARCLCQTKGLKAHLDVVGVEALGHEDISLVTFHGRVDQFSNPDFFANFFIEADVFVLPTHHECAGIVFAEAASFGLPSISYRTGGVPDYVKEGVSGYLLPEGSCPEAFADVIAGRLGTLKQRTEMGYSAFEYYEQTLSKSVFMSSAKACLDKLM